VPSFMKRYPSPCSLLDAPSLPRHFGDCSIDPWARSIAGQIRHTEHDELSTNRVVELDKHPILISAAAGPQVDDCRSIFRVDAALLLELWSNPVSLESRHAPSRATTTNIANWPTAALALLPLGYGSRDTLMRQMKMATEVAGGQ
jgi:hypothetical protein